MEFLDLQGLISFGVFCAGVVVACVALAMYHKARSVTHGGAPSKHLLWFNVAVLLVTLAAVGVKVLMFFSVEDDLVTTLLGPLLHIASLITYVLVILSAITGIIMYYQVKKADKSSASTANVQSHLHFLTCAALVVSVILAIRLVLV